MMEPTDIVKTDKDEIRRSLNEELKNIRGRNLDRWLSRVVNFDASRDGPQSSVFKPTTSNLNFHVAFYSNNLKSKTHFFQLFNKFLLLYIEFLHGAFYQLDYYPTTFPCWR